MIRYQVRSKELIDLVNEIKSKRLIMSPYFQRNLVWREIHKVDFIKTILMGLPFPQIFIAKGSIDLESMTSTSCIVDGQQRMSAIVGYVSGEFKVDAKLFKDLNPDNQTEVLKYQIPIIDLDINNDAPEIKEIFQRLNRTFYSLNTIEKMSTEFASSEFMLFAKHVTGEVIFELNDEDEDDNLLLVDPSIPERFITWAKAHDSPFFKKLIVEGGIFTPYEISRQVHLMYALNLIATKLGGSYSRNDLAKRYLEEHKESFDQKDDILSNLEATSEFIINLNIPTGSYWLNKANMFTLFTVISDLDIDAIPADLLNRLQEFERNLPNEYQIAAKEGINNRKERLTRQEFIKKLMLD